MSSSPSGLRLPDVNVLVAASLSTHEHHDIACDWFERVGRWATCATTQAGYVRLLLNPNISGFVLSPDHVLEALRALTGRAGHEFLIDDVPLADPVISLSHLKGAKQVTDMHLVDLAARHGARLVTLDSRLPSAVADVDRKLVEILA